MTNLIPEKRLDKNGVLTTKHVRATPKGRNSASSVPAPSLGTSGSPKASKSVQKAYKPRPSQTAQKPRKYGSNFAAFNVKLSHQSEWASVGGTEFIFVASDKEMYDVFRVAECGDAIRLLHAGVRTAEDAVKYMRSKGADDAIVDMSELTQGAFERGISAENFMLRLPNEEDRKSPYALDALDLFSYSAISGQYYGSVHRGILSGELRLDDIKDIGVTKFKSYNRLGDSVKALIQVHEPDQNYTLDDLKALIERANSESADSPTYKDALKYMMDEGPEVFKHVATLKDFSYINASNYGEPDKNALVAYECEFFNVIDRNSRHRTARGATRTLLNAGVPATEAARLMNEGLTENAIIGVYENGTEKALASGWL